MSAVQASTPGATRSVPREDSAGAARLQHRPSVLAMAERQRADFWRYLCVGGLLLSTIVSYFIIRVAREPDRVFVLDPAGNILAGPSEPMGESRGFFNLTALQCTHAMLQRSAEGFDLYELVRLYFAPRAVQKLDEAWLAQRDDAQARNLQQKPIVERIAEPVVAGAARLVELRGRLVRAGAYAGRSFYEELPFVAVLTLVRNPDLGKAGAYPWICQDYELKLQELSE